MLPPAPRLDCVLNAFYMCTYVRAKHKPRPPRPIPLPRTLDFRSACKCRHTFFSFYKTLASRELRGRETYVDHVAARSAPRAPRGQVDAVRERHVRQLLNRWATRAPDGVVGALRASPGVGAAAATLAACTSCRAHAAPRVLVIDAFWVHT